MVFMPKFNRVSSFIRVLMKLFKTTFLNVFICQTRHGRVSAFSISRSSLPFQPSSLRLIMYGCQSCRNSRLASATRMYGVRLQPSGGLIVSFVTGDGWNRLNFQSQNTRDKTYGAILFIILAPLILMLYSWLH